jgi:uncharacterized membrane protein
MLASLIIAGRDWFLPVAVFLAVSLAAVAWSYRRDSAPGAVRLVCAALKLLGLLTLGAVLLEPLWSGERARPGANLFVVLADNSQGMGIKDVGAAKSRGELMRGLLTGDTATWPSKLEDNFQVRRYVFDSRLQSTRDFSELNFDGRTTSLSAALRNITDRYQGQPLSGVLLLTDGNATDLTDGRLDTAGLPPVYPVVMGGDETIKDISLQRMTVSQTAFEDAPVSIQADAAQGGYSGRDITAQLFDASGKKVQEQTLRAGAEGDVLPFRFQVKPEKPGLSFYRVRVSALDELGQFDKPETSTEATLANNSRVVVVNRGRGPYRILYLAGQPKWEFKFMNRALAEDDQIELASLIRIAKREPKFDFRGRAGESSNPLFRGFDNQEKDEVPQYDQPVLERQLPPEADTNDLAGGFPKTAEELYSYSAVVVDDMEAEFFTQDQMALLKRFVSERGGGFMMMGGTDSFHEGHYDRTPISDLLPVYIDHVPDGPPLTNEQLALSKEGWVQPWARLRGTEADERLRQEAMPRLTKTGVNRVREIKPGASLIATVHDEADGDHPALVVQRFGNGRVAALLVSAIWQWGFHDAEMHKDMDKAWRQLYRWLVADVPTRVDFQVETKPGDANQAVLLQVRVRDKIFQPMDNATVVFSVQAVTNAAAGSSLLTSTNAARLTADASSSEPGLYEATYIPRDTGGYLATAVATDSAGAEVSRAEAGWTADPAAEEFKSLKPNRALMEQLARQTGGQIIAAGGLDSFVAGLPNRKAPITESWTSPLWHRPAVFLFALGCFVAEWGLRRARGMA